MNAGLKMEAALSLAHTIEERLKSRKRPEIGVSALKKLLVSEVEKAFGPEVAERLRRQTQTFEEIMVVEPHRKRPFSKGVLTRSLEDAGFALKEAYAIAREIEAQLRKEGVTQIPAEELERRVGRAIERRFGRSARRRYAGRHALVGEIFVEEKSGEPRIPFSKGILAQSVMAAGLSPDAAYRLAREVERRLREGGEAVVSRDRLRATVAALIQEEVGEEAARRYVLLRALRQPIRPVHILIGGVTGVGKSLLASALAYRLGITRLISTDAVREILRATIPPDLLPTLHASSFEAWSVMVGPQDLDPETRILQGFRDQVSRVAVGLRAIQERGARERSSLIIEGVHVVPGYLAHPGRGDVIQIPLLVVVEDESVHRDRFILRDRETHGSRPLDNYLHFFKEIRLIQVHLQELAASAGIPIVSGESLDRATEQAMEFILDGIQKAYPQEPVIEVA